MLLARFEEVLDWPRETRVGLLGGKGDGLMRMAGELGLPVPPGFVLTTDACRLYLEGGWTAELDAVLDEGMAGLESKTGLRFGGAGGHGASEDRAASSEPLLVSVRSGAPASMPGMLDTLLNVGLDEWAAARLALVDTAFVASCRARLDAGFETSVGGPPPADARAQLRAAVEAVFRSVRSPRAAAYRRHEGLADELVTAVNVQAMVFGNRDANSATGVYFTRDPATGAPRPYGDVLFRAQGEDVVSGRAATEPLGALEGALPEVARSLYALGDSLEREYRDLVEIEFTIDSGRLWLLQVRVGKRSPRAALRIASDLALDRDFPLDRREAVERVRSLLVDPPTLTRPLSRQTSTRSPSEAEPSAQAVPLARGLGASPGIVSGELETSIARALEHAGADRPVILVRPETSPADVEGMAVAAGLLTSRGGLASHAAVVARGWGIPAVVGLATLEIDDGGIMIDGRRLVVGEAISIDGETGEVWAGAVPVDTHIVPEASSLLAWARELGIDLATETDRLADGSSTGSSNSSPTRASGAGSPASRPEGDLAAPSPIAPQDADVLQVLAIKGSATEEGLAAALLVEPEALAAGLEELVAAGQLVPAKPLGLRLTEPAQARVKTLLEEDRRRIRPERAQALLVAFQPLDAHVKQSVTDWQLRVENRERVPNDHADPEWDAEVLAGLGSLVDEAARWLTEPSEWLPRLSRYSLRLARALAEAQAGDARFVASPRVDSLHGVWFELHEDLIRLARSSRAEEIAAGRAG